MIKRALLVGFMATIPHIPSASAASYTVPGSYCHSEDPLANNRALRFSGGKVKNISIYTIDVSCPMVLEGGADNVKATVTTKNTSPYRGDVVCTLIELSAGGTASQKKDFYALRVSPGEKAVLQKKIILKSRTSSVYVKCDLPSKFYLSNILFETSDS